MRVRVLAALCVLAGLSGCGGSSGGAAATPEAGTASPPAAARKFDPPTRFDPATGVALPREAIEPQVNLAGAAVAPLTIALVDSTAFIVTAVQVLVVDVLTGKTTATVTPEHKAAPAGLGNTVWAGPNGASMPLLAKVDGRTLVLATFRVDGSASSELVAIDAQTGARAWTLLLDTATTQLGVHDRTLILGNFGTNAVTTALDLSTRKVVWSKPGVETTAVAGDSVIVIDGRARAALSVSDGAQRWRTPADVEVQSVTPAGDRLVVMQWITKENKRRFNVLDTATGAVKTAEDTGNQRVDCVDDQAGVVVCHAGGGPVADWVGALDPGTGTWRWELPAQGREAPGFTAAWHGAVYGRAGGKPVVLDARTGTEREASPGIAPLFVSAYAGLAIAGEAGNYDLRAFHPTA
ncbi:PQQ-binding-like beta-propeller repeat protein [Dactylosporangium siamense]|nr:PQQ-binding-like beta-propeller repeat protein [Dactylosporangium siamense]